jgi:lipid-A-disaccharide synthase-like uncharacterized protein
MPRRRNGTQHLMDLSKLALWWASISNTELAWLAIGFLAQLMFSMRFIIQWLASERARQSIVPEAFWYFSFAGGLMLFAYAIYRFDPVFMLGQGGGLLIYARNIHFIWQSKERRLGEAAHPPPRAASDGSA